MDIVLLEDVKALGKKGEIVNVSDGYARNMLLPKKLGIEATAKNLNELKLQKAHEDKVAAEQLAEAQAFAKEIEDKQVTVAIKVGEGGKVFGSVSAKAKTQWECSVVCAEKSTPDSYVITYSDAKILSNTGVLTVQNRNDFDITVHLLCEGKQELVSDSIPAGGCYSFQNVTDKEYTVGIHAEVDENTDIKAFVYDGKDTEPYTR